MLAPVDNDILLVLTLNGLNQPYLCELLHLHSPSWSLRSADQLLLDVLRTQWRPGDRTFAVVAPKLWDFLPLHVRQASSLDILKSS